MRPKAVDTFGKQERSAEATRLRLMYGLGVMGFMLFLSTLVGVPVLPRLCIEMGANLAVIPVVVSASLVTGVLVQFFAGALADRFSRKILIVAGALLGSASSLLCVVAVTWPQLLALRIVGGIADSIVMPSLLAITASLGENRPGRFFGILRSGQGLAFVAGPLFGGAFSLVSLRTPFLVDGLLSLAAMLAAMFLVPAGEKAGSAHDLGFIARLGRTFSDGRVYLYLLVGVSGLFGFGILYAFVATKAQLLELAPWQVGAILGGGALVFSVVSYVAGRLSETHNRKTMVIASEVIMLIGIAGLVWSPCFISLVAFYGLFCVGEATVFLLSFALAAGIFDKRYMGTSMGAFDSVMDLSLFIGPVLATAAYGATGMLTAAFLIACVPAAMTLACVALWLPANGSTVPGCSGEASEAAGTTSAPRERHS